MMTRFQLYIGLLITTQCTAIGRNRQLPTLISLRSRQHHSLLRRQRARRIERLILHISWWIPEGFVSEIELTLLITHERRSGEEPCSDSFEDL